jgi:8-oxo-dGTP diphosphatase
MSSQKITHTVRLILENQGHILLLAQTTKNGGKYALVGGKVEFSESLTEALIRECKEETDIELNLDDLKLVHVMYQQKRASKNVIFFFHAIRWEGYGISKELQKFKSTAWFPLHQCPENLSRITKAALQFFQNNITLSEFKDNQ